MTLLTLYQPPPPLLSGPSYEELGRAVESASDPNSTSGSDESGGSDGSIVAGITKHAHWPGEEGDFRFTAPDLNPDMTVDDQQGLFAQEGDGHGDSGLIVSMDSVALRERFPSLMNGLREVNSLPQIFSSSIRAS